MGGYLIPKAKIELSRGQINENVYKELFPYSNNNLLEYEKTKFYIKINLISNKYENDVIYIKNYNGSIYDSIIIIDGVVKNYKKCEDRLYLKIKYKSDTFDYNDYHIIEL
jgi:hypothetical protein